MSLSANAQVILDTLERIRIHPETEQFLEEDLRGGLKWLPMTNIINHFPEVFGIGVNEPSEEFKALLDELDTYLNEYLISTQGGHSYVFYELQKAGYTLYTGEKDSFGPLSAVIHCPNADWRVCYG